MSLVTLDEIAAKYGFELCDVFKIIKLKEKSEKTSETTKATPDDSGKSIGDAYKELERETNKALGILIEDGPFAYSVWLESKNEAPHKSINNQSIGILKDENVSLINNNNLREGVLNDIASDLNKLILTKKVLERMLIYARYRAKALQKGVK